MKTFTNRKFTHKLILAICFITFFNFCMVPKVQAANFGGEMMGIFKPFVVAIADVVGKVVQYAMTGDWQSATAPKGSGTPTDEDYFVKTDKFEYPILQISPELIFANKIEFLDANFITSSTVEDSQDKYLLKVEDDNTLQKLRNIIAGWYVTLRTISVVGLLSVLIYIGIRIIISSTSADKAKYKQRLVDWIVAFCLLFFMHYIMAGAVTVVDKVNAMLANIVNVEDGLTIDPEFGKVQFNKVLGGSELDYASKISFKGVKDWFEDNNYEVRGWNPPYEEGSAGFVTFGKAGESTKQLGLTVMNGKAVITGEASSGLSADEINDIEGVIQKINNEINESNTPDDSGVLTESIGTRVSTDPSKVLYFTNYARLFLNAKNTDENAPTALAYLIIYVALITFTAVFAFRYVKRVIYIAFLTLIAPTVALTYPIDKIKDGKAQAWNMWFKEYVFNLLIQPFHLLIYTILVGSAIELATTSLIYAVIAIYFVIPAEKLLRKFFGFDNAGTLSAAGSFAGGALFSAMINRVNRPKPPEPKDEPEKYTRNVTKDNLVSSTKALDRSGNIGGASGSSGGSAGGTGGTKEPTEGTDGTGGLGGTDEGKTLGGLGSATSLGGTSTAYGGISSGSSIDMNLLKSRNALSIKNKDGSYTNFKSLSEFKKATRGKGRFMSGAGGIADDMKARLYNKATTLPKSAGRKLRRVGLGALGAGTMGMLALGAGAATGDPAKAAALALSAGAAGYNFTNFYGDKAAKIAGTEYQKGLEGYWGEDYKKVQQFKFDEKFKQSPELKSAFRKAFNDPKALDAAIKDGTIQQFLDNGHTDPGKIAKATKLMKNYESRGYDKGRALEKAVAMANWHRSLSPSVYTKGTRENEAFKRLIAKEMGLPDGASTKQIDDIIDELDLTFNT